MLRILGVDEVGRGCWAGPVVAGAVILLEPIDGLRDSKLLSPKAREKLAIIIKKKSLYGLGWASPKEVDELGLTNSVGLAMKRAVALITEPYDRLIIDGNFNLLKLTPKSETIIKADKTVPAVSAASIIAKVARDQYMFQQSKLYPHYIFDKHVGYGTALHRSMLLQHGPCEIHRISYKPIKAMMAT